MLLAAGLKGIEEGYELPAEAEGDIASLTAIERRALGYRPLPENLHRALHYIGQFTQIPVPIVIAKVLDHPL